MRAIDPTGFEQKFCSNIDPWNYTHSRFEDFKRDRLLRACGLRMHGRVLELGCAIGETTRFLAPLSLRLVAVDASPTALAEAQKRVGQSSRVIFHRSIIPQETPRGPFDLIVAAEIAYYLPVHQMMQLAERIYSALAPHGLIVLLNHRRSFDDAAQQPGLAHRHLRARLGRRLFEVRVHADRHFDIAVLRRRTR